MCFPYNFNLKDFLPKVFKTKCNAKPELRSSLNFDIDIFSS